MGQKFNKYARGAYDAIVYIDGSEVVAEDANGRKIASGVAGVDDYTVINSAIPYGNVVLDGNFVVNSSYPIYIHDIDGGSLTSVGFGTTISNSVIGSTDLSKGTIVFDNVSNYRISSFQMNGVYSGIPNSNGTSGNIVLLNDSHDIFIDHMVINGGFDGISIGIPDTSGETRIASHDIQISDVNINGTEHGVRICGGYAVNLNGVVLKSSQRGLFLQGAHDINANNVQIYDTTQTAVLISGQSAFLVGAPDEDCHDINLNNLVLSGNTVAFQFQEYASYASQVYDINVNNLNLLDSHGVFIYVNALLSDYAVHDITFSNLRANLSTYYAYTPTTRCIRDFKFINCDFVGSNPTALFITEKSPYGTVRCDRNLSFIGCKMNNSVGDGIRLGYWPQPGYPEHISISDSELLAGPGAFGLRVSNGNDIGVYDSYIGGYASVGGTPTNLHYSGWRGSLSESAGSSTGTGSEQTIAHGLAAIPTGCKAWIKIEYPVGSGRYITKDIPFDATNVYPTVDNGVAFEWGIA